MPVERFDSGNYDINVIKSYLVTYHVDKVDGLNVTEEEEDEEVQRETKDVKEQQAFKYVVNATINSCASRPKI